MTTLARATSQPDYESGGVPLPPTLAESAPTDSTTSPPPHFWASPLTADQLRAALLGPSKRTGRTILPRSKLEAQKNIITTDLARLQRVADEEAYRAAVLEKRYGVTSGAGALSEEEMLAYAMMISRERLEFEVRVDAGAENGGSGDEKIQRAIGLSLEDIRVEEVVLEREVESWPTLREAEEEVRRRNMIVTPGVEVDEDGEFARQTELAVRASLEETVMA